MILAIVNILIFFLPEDVDVSEILDTLQEAASGLDTGEMYGVIIGAVVTVLVIVTSAFLIYKCCRRRCKS